MLAVADAPEAMVEAAAADAPEAMVEAAAADVPEVLVEEVAVREEEVTAEPDVEAGVAPEERDAIFCQKAVAALES